MYMAMEEYSNEAQSENKGKMIVFASAKGGVGKTIISVNISSALAQKGYSTCILDGSFQFGDVNLAFDLKPKLTISDLIQDTNSLNSNILSNYLIKHESGVKVLSAPLKPEYADLITPTAVMEISQKILEQNKFLVVDLAAGLSEQNISFMEQADKVYIVSDLEMAALKNTKAMIKTLNMLQMEDKISVIVNRGNMESVIKFKDVDKILEFEDIFFISNDFKIVSKSFNMGTPFVLNKPNERITKDILTLVNVVCERKFSGRSKRKKKSGILSFLKVAKA
jgi:pilus assembly protein CpaE